MSDPTGICTFVAEGQSAWTDVIQRYEWHIAHSSGMTPRLFGYSAAMR